MTTETVKNAKNRSEGRLKIFWENFFTRKERSEFDLLRNCPIFSDLSKRELAFIYAVLHKRLYTNGEIVFKSQSNAGMYLILKGGVNILQGAPGSQEEPSFIASLKQGDFFGELALVDKTAYEGLFIQANQNSRFLAFYQPDLELIAEKRPQTSIKILKKLAQILSLRLKKFENKTLPPK